MMAQSVIPILFTRFTATIIFGVFYSSIALILTSEFHFSPAESIGLGGMFFGFHYVLPLLGGVIGDKLINFKQLFLYGKCFQLLGLLFLLFAGTNLIFLYAGLGLILVDSLANSTCINMLLSKYCENDREHLRSVVFMRNQLWANCGFFTAFLISGALFSHQQTQSLILFCFVLCVSVLIMGYKFFPDYKNEAYFQKNYFMSSTLTIVLMSSLALILSLTFMYSTLSKAAIILLVALSTVFMLPFSYRGLNNQQKKLLNRFYILLFSSIAFWCVYMLTPTFLPLFLNNSVDRHFFGFELPPQWIQLVGSIIEIAFGFIVTRWVYHFSSNIQSVKISFFPHISGLLFAAIALAVLILGLYLSDAAEKLQAIWVFLFMTFIALGETFLSPANFSMVGELVPKHLQGRCTGMAQLIVGVSVMLAGMIAENCLSGTSRVTLSLNQYILTFSVLAVIAAVVGLCLRAYESRVFPQSKEVIKDAKSF